MSSDDTYAVVRAGRLGGENGVLEERLSRLTSSDAASYADVLGLVERMRTLRAEQDELVPARRLAPRGLAFLRLARSRSCPA